jgi:hypothetical protein
MNVKNFLSVYALAILVYGILFLFMPAKAISMYGGESSPLLVNAIQGLGSVFIPAGVMAWLAREASASYGRRAILVFIGLSSLIFAIRNIMAMSGGASTSQSTIDLVVQLVFTAGGLYFLSKEKGF